MKLRLKILPFESLVEGSKIYITLNIHIKNIEFKNIILCLLIKISAVEEPFWIVTSSKWKVIEDKFTKCLKLSKLLLGNRLKDSYRAISG